MFADIQELTHRQITVARALFALLFVVFAVTWAAARAADQPTSAKALSIVASDPALKWGPCPPIFPAGCEITVLHGDPTKPNADAFLRVPAGYEIPAHWHTSPERMILVTGKLRVTYKGQPAATLATGNYAYGPAKLAHKASCLSAEPCTLFIAFESAVDAHAHKGALD